MSAPTVFKVKDRGDGIRVWAFWTGHFLGGFCIPYDDDTTMDKLRAALVKHCEVDRPRRRTLNKLYLQVRMALASAARGDA